MRWVAAVLVVGIAGVLLGGYAIATHNEEVRLRNAIAAKQRDNVSEYDALWKKIAQAAQVTDAHRKALLEVLTAYAEARGGGSDGGIITWIHESVPDVDPETFRNLQNIIAGSRDSFAMRQRELLALAAEHDTLLDAFPSGAVLAMLGRERIDVTVVTSTQAQKTFEQGVDDAVELPLGQE
jgi:hypothetical protein